MTPTERNSAARREELIAPLRARPDRSAVLCDIDGTIAPIVARPEDASVPEPTRKILNALNRRYALVVCLSGRRATDARRVVGSGSIAYIGNHGLEYLAPGAQHAEADPALSELAAGVQAFANGSYTRELRNIGVRLEDKDLIWSFHWRQAADERAARRALARIAGAAEEQGLVPYWGRKVLEIRPPMAVDKGTALAAALRDRKLEAALYGGDDATDLEAFRKLRELRDAGEVEHVVCVGVRSSEGPAEITSEADLVVGSPEEFIELLSTLAT